MKFTKLFVFLRPFVVIGCGLHNQNFTIKRSSRDDCCTIKPEETSFEQTQFCGSIRNAKRKDEVSWAHDVKNKSINIFFSFLSSLDEVFSVLFLLTARFSQIYFWDFRIFLELCQRKALRWDMDFKFRIFQIVRRSELWKEGEKASEREAHATSQQHLIIEKENFCTILLLASTSRRKMPEKLEFLGLIDFYLTLRQYLNSSDGLLTG